MYINGRMFVSMFVIVCDCLQGNSFIITLPFTPAMLCTFQVHLTACICIGMNSLFYSHNAPIIDMLVLHLGDLTNVVSNL